MVPGYDDLVFVWLFGQPCKLRLYLGERAPLGEMAGMKKKVTRWDRWSCTVCVGDALKSSPVDMEMEVEVEVEVEVEMDEGRTSGEFCFGFVGAESFRSTYSTLGLGLGEFGLMIGLRTRRFFIVPHARIWLAVTLRTSTET